VLNARVNDSFMINAGDLPDFSTAVRVVIPGEMVSKTDSQRFPYNGKACEKITIVNLKGSVIALRDRAYSGNPGKPIRRLTHGAYIMFTLRDGRKLAQKKVVD
jgi:hypothetical protein